MPIQPYPTGGGKLRSTFDYLRDFGLIDFVLPFLLLFALFFAVLQRVKLFKTIVTRNQQQVEIADRRINGILSLALSLMVTIPHAVGMYPRNFDPILLINQFIPHTIVMLMAVFVMLLLLGLAGAEMPSGVQLMAILVAVVVLALIFMMNVFPAFMPTFYFLRDPAVQALIIVLLTMGLVGYFVIRPERGEELPKKLRRWMGHPPPVRAPAQPPAQPGP